MGVLLHTIYNYLFKYLCIPVFLLMLIGRPRFLISLVHKLINSKEPFFQLKLFRFFFTICCIVTGYSYFRKYSLDNQILKLNSEQQKGTNNLFYIDEKLREAHLYERNTYMFFTFIIMMMIVEKFCHSYFKLWNLEDEAKAIQMKDQKTPELKKKD